MNNGFDDIAYVADGPFGVYVINVTDKTNPALLDNYPSYARGVHSDGSYLYTVDDLTSMNISMINDDGTFTEVGSYGLSSNVYGVFVVNNGFDDLAFVENLGVQVFNITDKNNPQFLQKYLGWSLGIYSDGSYLYSASGASGLYIAKINTPV